MVSKSLFIQLLVRVLGLLINCFAIAFVALNTGFYMVWINLLLVLAYQVWEMIRHINKTNRKIAAIIDNLQSNDTTISIPTNATDPSLLDLYASLRSLVETMAETKANLVANNQFYKHLIEHSASGLLAMDEDGKIVMANAAAANLLGIEHLHNIKQIIHRDPQLASKLQTSVLNHSLTHLYWNGTAHRTLDIKASQLKLKEQQLLLISLQDITDQLEQQEIQSWQKLIRVLTHEIMNSIAPITSLSNAIRQRIAPKTPESITDQDLKKTTEGLAMVEERTSALTDFITAYRQLAQLPQPKYKTIYLPDFLQSICHLMQEELDSDQIQLTTHFAPIDVQTDPSLLAQVIINLLKNAREAIADQSRREIHLKAVPKPEHGYVISISDSGSGIAPTIADKIFVPFYTTKEKGSGIGLSLSKQIILSLGGTIRVQSHIHDFTTFILEF